MKVSSADLAALRKVVSALDTDERRATYKAGDFPRSELTKDLDKRYRWDLLWDTRGHKVLTGIDGYQDAHIDTALRSIVLPL